jgi:hypothetical protein
MSCALVDLQSFNEPWRVSTGDEPGAEYVAGLLVTRLNEIVVDPVVMAVPDEHVDFYLRRIRLCVNACVGLANYDLERLKPGELAVLVLDDRAKKVTGR